MVDHRWRTIDSGAWRRPSKYDAPQTPVCRTNTIFQLETWYRRPRGVYFQADTDADVHKQPVLIWSIHFGTYLESQFHDTIQVYKCIHILCKLIICSVYISFIAWRGNPSDQSRYDKFSTRSISWIVKHFNWIKLLFRSESSGEFLSISTNIELYLRTSSCVVVTLRSINSSRSSETVIRWSYDPAIAWSDDRMIRWWHDPMIVWSGDGKIRWFCDTIYDPRIGPMVHWSGDGIILWQYKIRWAHCLFIWMVRWFSDPVSSKSDPVTFQANYIISPYYHDRRFDILI